MPRYLLSYHGGGMPETEEEQSASTKAWVAWFDDLGPALVDAGNPVGDTRVVDADGTVSTDTDLELVSGYSLLEAADIDAAVDFARDCPILLGGGTIEVGEIVPTM